MERRDAFRHQKPIAVGGMVNTYFAWVDLEDSTWARRIRWSAHRWFAEADVVARGVVAGKREYLHRLIAIRAHGPAPSEEHVVEFVNGDRLDCRRVNVRWAHKDHTVFQQEKRDAKDERDCLV